MQATTTTAAAAHHTGDDERSAAARLADARPLERARIAGEAAVRLFRDPEDTEQVFVLGLVLNRRRFPELLARFAVEPEGAWLLYHRPAIDRESVDWERLRALPADTLGGAYARFLDERGLDPDVFKAAPPGIPETAAYVAKRFRQTHDLWHVLTGYDTSVAGEAAVLAFTWAQTRMPSAGIVAALAGVRSGGPATGSWRRQRDAIRRGRAARFLGAVKWEDRWERPLVEVREELGITAAAA
ncbi:MAG: hypothetical protein KC635_25505 [Myxococcales bacterium]|nr:hypothetical protein [Myxococcales bacterium]MCB9732122.1 hypothetical protein [Deltaproteobacteria bacterium]